MIQDSAKERAIPDNYEAFEALLPLFPQHHEGGPE